MEFKQALELMKLGEKVKRPHWSGYWQLEDGAIKMYCKDGQVLDFRETKDTLFTISNVLADDWEVADTDNSKLINGEIINTFTFGEALRNLKHGKKVARQGWNGKGMFIYLTTGSIIPVVSLRPETAKHLFGESLLECDKCVAIRSHIDMKAADGTITIGWNPSQVDMLADDWQIVE